MTTSPTTLICFECDRPYARVHESVEGHEALVAQLTDEHAKTAGHIIATQERSDFRWPITSSF